MIVGVLSPPSSAGLLLKKWTRYWMTLDEDGAVLRIYKNDSRRGVESQLFMKWVSITVTHQFVLILGYCFVGILDVFILS